MSFITHLECSRCGRKFDSDRVQTVCDVCGKPLLSRYDMEAASRALDRRNLRGREATMWRYFELLPVKDKRNIVSLGEGWTPLTPAQRLGETIGIPKLWIKDESIMPTGSFKARGISAAISKAKELGIRRVAMPSAGNAAGALAAYGARAGMDVYILMPEDAPRVNIVESHIAGAKVFLVKGLITDAGRLISEGETEMGWFNLSTLREPYRIEGKKTMGFEIVEQMGWSLPDIIVYPTGGGTGIIGIWKAFQELEDLGWIGDERPRMVPVQAEGCAPLYKAYIEGKPESEYWEGAKTIAAGIRVPKALGDFLILRIVRESGGMVVSVSDEEIIDSISLMAKREGIFPCPEGAATLAALRRMVEEGRVDRDEKVVIFNTGSGLKYVDLFPIRPPTIDPKRNRIQIN